MPLQHTASYDAQVSEWLWGKVGSGPAPEISVPMKLAEGLRWVAVAVRGGGRGQEPMCMCAWLLTQTQ